VNGGLWISGALAVGAFLLSLLGARLVERYAQSLRLIDLPNLRSSHTAPKPRGGGLGIVGAVVITLAAAELAGAGVSREAWVLLIAAVLVSLVGLWDDVRSLAVSPRLIVQTLAAVGLVAILGGFDRVPLPPPLDLALGPFRAAVAVIWLVGVVNFFNFMDGVDGLAAGQAIVSAGAVAWALWMGSEPGLAFLVAAASAGFLVRNWSPARVFLGDVGSAFLGLVLAGLPLTAPPGDRERLTLLVATTLTLFLLDPVATLIVRARRRARIGAAHREHAYQRLIAPDRSHAPGVMVLLSTSLILAIAAVAAFADPRLAWPSIGLAAAAFSIEWWLSRR